MVQYSGMIKVAGPKAYRWIYILKINVWIKKNPKKQQKPNHKKTPKRGWYVYMSVNSLIRDSFENTFVL